MGSVKKPRQARLYLDDENEAMLSECSDVQKDLPESTLTSMLLRAALRAAKRNGYHFSMPLEFEIVEPKTTYRSTASAVTLNDKKK